MSRSRHSVVLKSAREVEVMRESNRHTAEILRLMAESVRPGVTTWDLDQIARVEIKKRGVASAFLGYRGYPATLCASVNEEIIHGIPRRDKVLKEGDIIGLDFGSIYQGYVGDCACTVAVGRVNASAQRLMDVTEECLRRAIEVCTPVHRLSDISKAIQDYAESQGYSVVREFVGHGIGTAMHEEPQVPNYYDGPRMRLRSGMVLAIEPMVNEGACATEVLADGWTAITKDHELSAHFEHSVAITDQGPIVLSQI
jgi:methionyl aminopeptidase